MRALASGETQAPSFFELPVNNSTEAITENVRINALRKLTQLQQHEWRDRPVLVVGGGPSLIDYLPVLRAYRKDCDVLAINGAYKFLRSEGIEADHFMMIDSRRDNLVHVENPSLQTNHCLASQVHPEVFDELEGYPVTLFNLGTEATLKALGEGRKRFLHAPIGMASVHAIYVAAALGYRTQLLFGYDFSQKGRDAYAAYDQPMNKPDEAIEINLGGRVFLTSIALARTAEQFVRAVSPVINACKLDIQLYSDGLLSEVLKQGASTAPVEERERDKYEAMWGIDLYRGVSPGLKYIPDAVKYLKMPIGSAIADYGCGTGRAVRELAALGYAAVGVDIAANCNEEPIPFVQCALWDADKLPVVDYGFSTDVLEHIPPEKLRETLKAIHDTVEVACYFNIDTIADSFGAMIGQQLHLTVMPAGDWEALLTEFWPVVENYTQDERQAVFVCKR